jgi:uncharacterized protein (TIGR02145 family)
VAIISNTPYAWGEVAYRISGTNTDPITGRLKFATKNLGATTSLIDPLEQIQAPAPNPNPNPISSTDETIYGSMYQWGRYHDGHQSRSSANYLTNDNSSQSSPVATTNSSDGQVPLSDASYGKFIKNSSSSSRYDWSQTQNDLLWGGDNSITIPHSKGVADPCPSGFRVPSQAEWASIVAGVGSGGGASPYLSTQTPANSGIFLGVNKWQWVDGSSIPFSNTPGFLIYPPKSDFDFSTTPTNDNYQTTPTLFLPAAGSRSNSNGSLGNAGALGFYWSSTVSGTGAYFTYFTSGSVLPISSYYRAYGLSVRCLSE